MEAAESWQLHDQARRAQIKLCTCNVNRISNHQSSPCSRAIALAMRGPLQIEGNRMSDTGTAVTTIKDCSAETPPEPIDMRIAATTPIITPQNILRDEGG